MSPCLTMAEQGFKKIAEAASLAAGIPCAPEFKTGIPVGRRLKILAFSPVGAEFVVGSPFFGVFQNFIGLADILEFGFGVGFLADVGVKFACNLAIGLFDLVLGCIAGNAQYCIVVFVFHADGREPVYEFSVLNSKKSLLKRKEKKTVAAFSLKSRPCFFYASNQ